MHLEVALTSAANKPRGGNNFGRDSSIWSATEIKKSLSGTLVRAPECSCRRKLCQRTDIQPEEKCTADQRGKPRASQKHVAILNRCSSIAKFINNSLRKADF